MKPVVVSCYDPAWPAQFEQLRERIWPQVSDIAIALEHVGSTSVPGLAAKPVIDLDIVIRSTDQLPPIVARLAGLGYQHRGDLGVDGRDAFRAPKDSPVAHHLYVCAAGSLALRNHLLLRDHLRSHPDSAAGYAALKLRLAARFPYDMDRYVEGKTSFILGILRRNGIGLDEAAVIDAANRAATGPADPDSGGNSPRGETS